MKLSFNVHFGESRQTITSDQLDELAVSYGLDRIAQGRYSSLFVLNLLVLERVDGIPHPFVVNEIKALEGLAPPAGTKAAAEFSRARLRGLWHKHFFVPMMSSMGHNIANELAGDRLAKLVAEVFDPKKNSVITEQMVNELAHGVVVDSFESRAQSAKLTGEWIVFAKEAGQNYYLCVARHDAGDENIAKHIRETCVPQFPFLQRYVS